MRMSGENFSAEIIALSNGPFTAARSYKACDINGFRFRTKEVDDRRATQNCGVALNADTLSFSSRKDNNPCVGIVFYYGLLADIIEIRYTSDVKAVLFMCDWVDPRHGVRNDDYKFTLVNFNNLMYKDDRISNEPYILASQAEQVYFVGDPIDPNWHVAVKMSRRGVFEVDCDDPEVQGYPRQDLSDSVVPAREQDANWMARGRKRGRPITMGDALRVGQARAVPDDTATVDHHGDTDGTQHPEDTQAQFDSDPTQAPDATQPTTIYTSSPHTQAPQPPDLSPVAPLFMSPLHSSCSLLRSPTIGITSPMSDFQPSSSTRAPIPLPTFVTRHRDPSPSLRGRPPPTVSTSTPHVTQPSTNFATSTPEASHLPRQRAGTSTPSGTSLFHIDEKLVDG